MIIPKDIIILPEFSEACPDRWVAMNVFSRTCLGVSSKVLDFMSRVESMAETDSAFLDSPDKFTIWNIEIFSNSAGLLADPSRYIRNLSEWGKPVEVTGGELVQELRKHFLLIDNIPEYRNRFRLKESILDYDNFGNFHQQVGQHLMLVERKSPSKFWLAQKFTEDLRAVRSDNLYGGVQASYLANYFQKRIAPSDKVIDIGCGMGLYANMMASTGAEVLGIDPSEDYLRIARENAGPRTRFEVMDIGSKGALDGIPDQSADIVYMSDALLFYFVPVNPNQPLDIDTLFSDIRRILKPNGTFISLEAHFVFWLMPWLGSVDRPFTVITEYLNKQFGVTASISKLIQTFARGGFVVSYMDELVPSEEFKKADPRAFHFASEFPVWHLFELKKAAQ